MVALLFTASPLLRSRSRFAAVYHNVIFLYHMVAMLVGSVRVLCPATSRVSSCNLKLQIII